jgi:hypothetical protein
MKPLLALGCLLAIALSLSCAGGDGLTGPGNKREPVIQDLTPTAGPSTGGTIVSVTGGYLDTATRVRFGNADARIISASPDTTLLTVATPAHDAGVVDVNISTATGSVTRAAAFEYRSTITSCQFINGKWSMRVTGTDTLDAELNLSENGGGQVFGQLTLRNPGQPCAAPPWDVSGSFSHTDNTLTMMFTSNACRLRAELTGKLDFPACDTASGTGRELEGNNPVFSWTMRR